MTLFTLYTAAAPTVFGNSTYEFVLDAQSYVGAKTHCEDKGAHLVRFETKAEYVAVIAMMEANEGKNSWHFSLPDPFPLNEIVYHV